MPDKITKVVAAGWIVLVTLAYFLQYRDKIAALSHHVLGGFLH